MDPRDVVPTYRVLTEPIYDFQFWFISLTFIEVVVCFAIIIMSWGLYSLIGIDNLVLFGIPFDSAFCGLVTGLGAAVGISILHTVRPEGSIETYLFGLFQPTKYIGRTADKKWQPSLRPHWRKNK